MVTSFKPGPFLCQSTPLDFTVPGAAGQPPPAPAAPAEPAPAKTPQKLTIWQGFLLAVRHFLAWLLEIVERGLAA